MNKIIFTPVPDFVHEDVFPPAPAKNNIPEWYKTLESYINGKREPIGEGKVSETIKKCMPVFDVITAGYLLFTYVDIWVSKKEGSFYYEWPSGSPIDWHPISQAPNHPAQNGQPYPKFMNEWCITTPKGYSSLFINPTHRESPISILEGIVDTDTYTNTINFPFVIKDPNFEGLIPRGTPIVQVIPFERNPWRMEIGKQNPNAFFKLRGKLQSQFFDRYKTDFWHRKDYA
jgi:hypothetical protein